MSISLWVSRVKVVGEDKKLLDDFIINSYFSSKCVMRRFYQEETKLAPKR